MLVLELHYSLCQIILTFRTSFVGGFLIFGVLNAKNLVFNTLDASAVILFSSYICLIILF